MLSIEDKDRSVRGLANPLREEERLANAISDGIRPQILVAIELASFRKLSLLVLQVFPGPARPYHLARLGAENGSYIRVGSTNRRARSRSAR